VIPLMHCSMPVWPRLINDKKPDRSVAIPGITYRRTRSGRADLTLSILADKLGVPSGWVSYLRIDWGSWGYYE
jgi:hypothetical protein